MQSKACDACTLLRAQALWFACALERLRRSGRNVLARVCVGQERTALAVDERSVELLVFSLLSSIEQVRTSAPALPKRCASPRRQ
jgi:hypothetical protein